jgi:transposase-like protein
MEPGMNVSHVARLHGIQPSLLFKWKKQYQEGSLTAVAAGEEVVPASGWQLRSNRSGSFSVFWVRRRWKLRS